jgi:hypothetical protein
MVGAHTLCVIAIGFLCPLASLGHFMVPFLNCVSCDDGVGTMAFRAAVLLPRLGLPLPIAPLVGLVVFPLNNLAPFVVKPPKLLI